MKQCLALLILLIASLPVSANKKYDTGARSTALGHIGSTLKEVWSVSNNQANMAFLKHPAAGVAYEQRYGLKELGVKTVAFVLPTNRVGNFGMSYTHLGDSDYNETRINLGYAIRLGEKFAMGLAFDYLAMSVQTPSEGGSTGTVTGEIGIVGSPVKNLWLAAHAYNPFSVSISDYEFDEEIPNVLHVGALYYFEEHIFATVEFEKDINYDARFKAGVEYGFLKNFFVRGGIATNPTEYGGGVGADYKGFNVDLAFYKHQYLGYTPSIAVSYTFGK